METFKKIDGETLEITSREEAVKNNKTLNELEAELQQAKDSLDYVKSQHNEAETKIQKTIDLFQARVDEAKALGIKEIVKPITEEGEEVLV